jgi:site-specific recombinase XerD
MAKITLFLDTRRILKNEMYPLSLRLNHNNSNRLIPLKIFLLEDQWNPKSCEIKKTKNSKRDTATVQSKLAKAKTFLVDNEKKIARQNINEIREQIEYLISKKEDEPDDAPSGYLGVYGKIIVERTIKSGKHKTSIWYQDAINSITKFNNDLDLLLIEIDVTFLEKYKANCLSKNQSKNSISARLRAIRAIMNKAQKENESILVKSHKPFENFTIPSQKTSKRAVSKDVINSIRNFPLESNSAFWHDKNYFLFMFNMQGMNFIDLAKLKLRQISAGRLRYIRSKTNKPYDVKLTKEAEEILSYYITNKTPEDFVFPILNKEINKDSILVSKTSDQALHVFNNHIKKLAVQCGIDQPITSYVARHSWASAARKLGVSTDKIGDALGHENYSTTEVYLQDFDTDVLDEVNLLVTSK